VTGLLRRSLRQALQASRLPPLLHRMAPRQRVSVLMYHAVLSSPLAVPDWCFMDATVFRGQAEYLARHFEVVLLSEAVQRLRRRQVRRPMAVITFDDGMQSVHDVALPILKRLGLPATVFLTTGFVGTDDTPWHCRLNRALAAATRRSLVWREEEFPLDSAPLRARAGALLQSRLKQLPHSMLMHELRALVGALGDDAERAVAPGSPYRVMGPREVEALKASGQAEFGAHGVTHAILSLVPPDEREHEVAASLRAVADLTGAPCRLFAYPNGGKNDYTADVRKRLGELGVEGAVTSQPGACTPTTPRLELRRYGVGADMDAAEFQLAVHHALV
jgi:peptidoglycan/xylan/chitin deacetylase (PgdA/CDA1 family)